MCVTQTRFDAHLLLQFRVSGQGLLGRLQFCLMLGFCFRVYEIDLLVSSFCLLFVCVNVCAFVRLICLFDVLFCLFWYECFHIPSDLG